MIAALVLAGGNATRLGGVDKPLLRLGTKAVIEHVLDRLGRRPCAISANGDPARYAHLNLPVLADETTGRGPLGGVLRGLYWARALDFAWLLTVPGDTPFIPNDLLPRLQPGPAWADSSTGLHALVALWPTDCAPALRDWLDTDASGRVRSFGEAIGLRPVWFDDTPDPFANINTPDDLAAARARL